ncbi:uncharacterized protein LOC124404214 [Diprion similis]|uniref:uncharacterized protein LOC124404214 n=1 Tax=Diprion similis TaxID=362088 RepID=UPI001EF94D7E|nr:uncharacterized protein LOC124404214 [Diprion similis]
MAKFATALCLLVAVSGIRGSNETISAVSAITLELTNYNSTANQTIVTMEIYMVNMATIAENALKKLNSSMTAAIETSKSQWEELVNGTTTDMSSCENVLWDEYSEVAAEILANATTCIDSLTAEANSSLNLVRTDFETCSTSLLTLQKDASDCSSYNETAAHTCLESIGETTDDSACTDIATNLKIFTQMYQNFSDLVSGCVNSNAFMSFNATLKTDLDTAVECALKLLGMAS